MRHVPDAVEIEKISHYQFFDSQLEEALSTEHKNTCSGKKSLAYYHAFAPKIGDITTNYFNYLKIKELILELIVAFAFTSDSRWSSVIAIIIALYFALNSWVNDSLLFIPAEERPKIEKALTWKKSVKSHSINDSDDLLIQSTQTCRPSSSVVNYLSYGILSANSAVGTLAILSSSTAAKAFGAFTAALGTELGILYSHMVFAKRVEEFSNLLKYFRRYPRYCLRNIVANSFISLQVIKYFSLISFYYTAMGIFYLYSLSEQLTAAFGFPINSRALNIAMGIAGVSVFLTNFSLRFVSTLKKYFHISVITQQEINPLLKGLLNDTGYSSSQRKIDCTLEFLISGAGLIFSLRRLISNPLPAVIGICISISSLFTGLRAISLLPISEVQASQSDTYFLTHWLNGHSRLMKSTFLPFAAISKISNMLKTHSDIDLGFDGWDILCWTIIIGIFIGINSSSMYKTSIDIHLKYLKEKWRIETEAGPVFGKLACFYVASEDYPEPHQTTLAAIVNSAKENQVTQHTIYKI